MRVPTLFVLLTGLATVVRAADRPDPVRPAGSGAAAVHVLGTPSGDIQPQSAIDPSGTIHLVSFQGAPAGGNLNYRTIRVLPGRTEVSLPVRVNSEPNSAVAMGTIRGAQIALGREGRVHVAWNGTMKAIPANPLKGAPMLYARRDPGQKEFTPQRNLMQRTYGLDGGGAIAADASGDIYVAWHGRTDADPPGEPGRRVWFTRSRDDGATFTAEEPASAHPTGACACCGMRAWADPAGHLDLLFRGATGGTERGMVLLASRDRGISFRSTLLQPWPLKTCPMSGASFAAAGPADVFAAWETNGQVFFARIDPETGAASPPVAPPGDPHNRKHPALAVNARGEALLAWTEGTAWQRGGALAWQVFDASGRPAAESGRIEEGIPTWSLPAAVARPDGGFTLVH
jgi:hypothetical protein